MTRIWIRRDRFVRRNRYGTKYKRKDFCVGRDNLELIGNTVRWDGETNVRLEPKTAALLRHLMLSSGLCSQGELIDAIYPDPDNEPEYPENVLIVLVSKLRKVLVGHGWQIHNRVGQGYMLERVNEVKTC